MLLGWSRLVPRWFDHVLGWNCNAHTYKTCSARWKFKHTAVPHEIIQPVLIPHIQENRGMCLAQDNAPRHVARATLNMLVANCVRKIPLAAASPDLNPIENVSDWLKREVRRQPQPGNLQELSRLVARVWDTVPQRYLLNYVRSMRRRCQAVIAAGGGHIPTVIFHFGVRYVYVNFCML